MSDNWLEMLEEYRNKADPHLPWPWLLWYLCLGWQPNQNMSASVIIFPCLLVMLKSYENRAVIHLGPVASNLAVMSTYVKENVSVIDHFKPISQV